MPLNFKDTFNYKIKKNETYTLAFVDDGKLEYALCCAESLLMMCLTWLLPAVVVQQQVQARCGSQRQEASDCECRCNSGGVHRRVGRRQTGSHDSQQTAQTRVEDGGPRRSRVRAALRSFQWITD
jgi:hypothetical protein